MDTPHRAVVETFFEKFTKLAYKKGEVIIRAGDPPPGVLYLKKGLVRMSFTAETGDMLVLHVFKPGSYFPMMWVVNDTPNTYYYEAVTPVEIWRAPREEVRKFIKLHPEVMEHFMGRLLWGVSGMLQRMEYLVFESAYKKTVLLLLYYAKNLHGSESRGDMLPIVLTHKEVAAWIGTTRETASLQIETLKRKKLIQYKRRSILIPSIAALEREVEEGRKK